MNKTDALAVPNPWVARRFDGAPGNIVGDVGGDEAGPPVILLHGGGQTRHSCGRAMRELIGRGYYVINLDARGHGDSDWAPDGDYSIESQSEDLARVMDTLLAPPALVGASMGGGAALFLTGHHLRPSAALILVDMVPRVEQQGAAKILAFMRQNPQGFTTVEDAAEAVARYNPRRPRPQETSGLLKNLRWRNGRLHWHWDPRLLARGNGPEPPDLTARLNEAAARVRVPALLVRGLRSDIVSSDGVADLQSRIPHLEVFDVDGAGHMVAGDKNDAFNRGVCGFLARHLPARQASGGR